MSRNLEQRLKVLESRSRVGSRPMVAFVAMGRTCDEAREVVASAIAEGRVKKGNPIIVISGVDPNTRQPDA